MHKHDFWAWAVQAGGGGRVWQALCPWPCPQLPSPHISPCIARCPKYMPSFAPLCPWLCPHTAKILAPPIEDSLLYVRTDQTPNRCPDKSQSQCTKEHTETIEKCMHGSLSQTQNKITLTFKAPLHQRRSTWNRRSKMNSVQLKRDLVVVGATGPESHKEYKTFTSCQLCSLWKHIANVCQTTIGVDSDTKTQQTTDLQQLFYVQEFPKI